MRCQILAGRRRKVSEFFKTKILEIMLAAGRSGKSPNHIGVSIKNLLEKILFYFNSFRAIQPNSKRFGGTVPAKDKAVQLVIFHIVT